MFIFGIVFFFFKQKTAYDMLISDWSSDVCSSGLRILPRLAKARAAVDRRALRPAGVGARGGDGEGVATRHDSSFLDLNPLSCRPVYPPMVTAMSKPMVKGGG